MYSQDIGMEYSREKPAMLIIGSRWRQITEEIELLNQEKIRTLGEKETYKYLGIMEVDIIKQRWKKEIKKIISENEKVSGNQFQL